MATIGARVARVQATPWRLALGWLGGVTAAVVALFHRDALAMADIWWNSSTYGHCLFILPIVGWLVWQRAPELARLVPQAWWPGLVIVAAGAGGWLLGQAAGVGFARHLGLVLMLQGAVVACLGPAVARGLLFPLAYLLLLVPVGDMLVPPLQTITAKMCMVLLGVVGVPARIEGVFITIPNGYYEVAEACSGVKFLVAMIAYGALVANVCFRSRAKRAGFMAVAIAVPVLANGLRAFGTIYVGHLTDGTVAGEFDHVVYGWVFFAAVMVAVMAVSWRFFDRGPNDRWLDAAALQPVRPVADRPGRIAGLAGAVLLLAMAPLAWGSAIAAGGGAQLPAHIAPPDVPGWTRAAEVSHYPWRPRFDGADHRVIGHYRDAAGRAVDLAIVVYGHQAEGREIVGYGQGAVDPTSDWAWTDDTRAPPQGRAFRISAPGPVVREVVTFYRVGRTTTGSDTRVKLETLRARLLGGPQRAVAILVSAEQPGAAGSARPAIDAFLTALGDPGALADRMAGL
nr:exosortase A [Sphingomonas solaris]